MTNLPTRSQPSHIPTSMPPNMAALMTGWLRLLNEPGARPELPIDKAPTRDQRVGLEHRAASIHRWRQPAPIERVEEWLSAVLAPYDGRSTEADAELSLSVYVMAVDGVPGYAVEAACAAFIQAKVPGIKPGFRPTPAEIAAEASRQSHALAKEAMALQRVLAAKPVQVKVNPTRKAELIAIARDAIKHMPLAGQQAEAKRLGREVALPATPLSAQAELDKLMADAGKPIAPMSHELRAKMIRPEAAE